MRKIKFGIIGLGRFGKVHAYNLAYRIPNAELVAALANTDSSLNFAKDELGVKNIYKNLDEFLDNSEMEAVLVCSPSENHCEQIEKALKKGFHVFSEKPLGVNYEECKKVEEIVNSHKDKKFMIGFMRRYDKSYAYAKEKIDKGVIGTPYLIKATSIDPASQILDTIKYSKHSAGIFLDLGIHDIDLMHWFLNSEATEVYANGATFKYKELKENGDEETAIATYKFKNGAMGILHVGRAAPHGNHVDTEIVGTEGSIKISTIPEKNLAKIYDKSGVLTECVETFPERFEEAYIKEVEYFADCIINDKVPEVKVEDGTYSTKVGFATTKSLKENKIIFIS